MNELEKSTTETLQKVNLFGSDNADPISLHLKAVAHFATIQTAIIDLEARGLLRSSATGSKLSASERRAVRRHKYSSMLARIAKTARDIERNDPSFVNKFHTPTANKSDLSWLEAGRAFAADLNAVKLIFINEYAWERDFIAQLIAESDAFEDSINDQSSATGQKIDANASIDSILGQALKALRSLKVMIPNIFAGNPGKLAEWASASHIAKPKPKPHPTRRAA